MWNFFFFFFIKMRPKFEEKSVEYKMNFWVLNDL